MTTELQSIADKVSVLLQNSINEETTQVRAVHTEKKKPLFSLDTTEDTPDVPNLFSKLFCPVPSGCKDFVVTVHDTDSWDDAVVEFIPTKTDNYIWQNEQTYWAVYAIETGKSCMVVGPPGTGKTEMYREICAITNRPYIRINGMAGVEPTDIIGSLYATDGSTHYELADAGIAVKYGAFLAYDEPFKNSASVNMCFQNLFEKENPKLLLYGNPDIKQRHLKPDPRFRVALCDNVAGRGDDMHKYSSTEVQDVSFINRINIKLHMGYLPENKETDLIMSRYSDVVSVEEAKKLTKMAKLMRDAWYQGAIEEPFSPRTLLEWVEAYKFCGDIKLAFSKVTNYDNAPAATQDLIGKMFRDVNFTK